MKRLRFKKFKVAVLAILATLIVFGQSAESVWAENITYTGNGGELATAPDPAGTLNSLFPASSSSGNTITINYSGGADPARVFGGISGTESAGGNEIFLINGSVTDRIYGGYAMNADNDAIGNAVTMSGGSVTDFIAGGNSVASNAVNNKVFITGGTVASVYGGIGAVAGYGNQVTVNGATANITSAVTGGYSATGNVYDNRVALYDGAAQYVMGGQTHGVGAQAYGNKVEIGGGDTPYVYGAAVGGNNAIAQNNRVDIFKGTIHTVYGAYAYDTTSGTLISGNTVKIDGASTVVSSWALGGFAGQDGTASNNTVILKEGSVSRISGGYSQTGLVESNKVIISGGTVTGFIMGGQTDIHAPSGSKARDNVVIITGGKIQGDVYAGSAMAEISNNSIVISGTADLSAAKLFGKSGAGVSSGNTLKVSQYSGTAVKSIGDFEIYDFYIPANSAGGAALTVTDPADISGSLTKVNFVSGGNGLKINDQITLINDAGGLTAANINTTTQARQGMALVYNLELFSDSNNLYAIVRDAAVNPQTKALSEGRVAGLAFVNQGGDLVAGYGMSAARRAVTEEKTGFAPFFAGQGGSSRYDTGSHVDVDGFSLMTGLAWNNQTDYGKLLLGAFFEAGWGNYDSHNSFSGYASVKGDGDTEYYGGGVLGRFDFTNTGPGNIYAEASFRAGWSETDFSSGDLRDGMGNKADYDSGSAYYGAHLGLGYLWNVTENSTLDLYTKYFGTHQDSDNVTVTGDPIRFKSADSHRWRGGARFSHTLSTESGLSFTSYIGAAYEHEFDGEAKATAYGYSIDAPDLKGGTGMGELGLSFKPSADSGFSLDLGVQGYTGKREGVTGSFQLKFEF